MDLKGQLSNPREKLETLAEQGSRGDRRRRTGRSRAILEAQSDADSSLKREVGRYSNPARSRATRQAQRHLKPDEIEALLAAYRAGDLVRDIAAGSA